MIIYTLRNLKRKWKEDVFSNEIVIASLYVITGMLFPFMYQSHSPDISKETLNFLWLSTSVILLLLIGCFFVIMKLNCNSIGETYDEFCKRFISEHDNSFQKDVKRKMLHLLPVVVLIFFWILSLFLDYLGALNRWKLDKYSFSLWLIIVVGLGFSIAFGIGDLVRLNHYHSLPDWAKRWYEHSLVPNELNTFVSSAPMVLSLSFFVFFPFPLFFSVALVGSVSDATASMVGKKYGKHKIHQNSRKTIEGYIAGIASTFLIVILTFYSFLPLHVVDLSTILLLGMVASGCFFLVDACAKNITDNVLNPIVTGLGMVLVLLLS